MNRITSILGLVALLACGACGDDDDDGNGGAGRDAGTAGTAGGGGGGGTGGTGGSDDDGGFATVRCNPLGTGACQNRDDCPIVESGEARDSASRCGIGCLGEDDEGACASMCVADETGLSTECAACYVGIVSCSRDNCLTPVCLADADSAECFQCQVDEGCRDTFDDCSGLPPPR